MMILCELPTTYWLEHTTNVKVILFFWNRCNHNCCRIFRSPFVIANGFSIMEHQPTLSLMCALTWMPRLGLDGLVVVDQLRGHPNLLICSPSIIFYGDIWRILFIRLHFTLMGISLFPYQKLLHLCVKYLTSLNVHAFRSTDAVKHASLLMNAILNSYCKYCTCQLDF